MYTGPAHCNASALATRNFGLVASKRIIGFEFLRLFYIDSILTVDIADRTEEFDGILLLGLSWRVFGTWKLGLFCIIPRPLAAGKILNAKL